jgi:hypothetical protein
VSAIGSAVAAWRSRAAKAEAARQAATAVKAAQDVAAADARIAAATERVASVQDAEATSHAADQARRVVIEPSPIGMGRTGVVVRNRSEGPVLSVKVDTVTDGAALMVFSGHGPTRVEGPVEVEVLNRDEATKMLHLVGGAQDQSDIDQIRIVFIDMQTQRWQRVGKSEPIKLPA